MSILGALTRGYTPHLIISNLVRRFPQHAGKIRTAQAAGYTSDVILRHIIDKKDPDYKEIDRRLTEDEETENNFAKQKRDAATQAIGLLGTAGAVAAGGYALYNSGKAIRPNQILPAQRNMPQQRGGTTLNGTRRPNAPRPNLPGQQPQQLGYQPRQIGYQPRQIGHQQPQQNQPSPRGPQNNQPPSRGPQNTPPSNQPPQMPNIDKHVNLVRNLQVEPTFQNMISNGKDVVTTAAILRQILPKNKVAILDKTEGGLEGLVADYTRYMRDNPPAQREQFQPSQQQNNPNLPANNEQMQGQQQVPQVQMQQEQPQEQHQYEQAQAQQQEQGQEFPGNEMENLEEYQNEEPINQRISGLKNEIGNRKESSKNINPQSFSIPGYKHANETGLEFGNRRKVNDTIQSAAKMLAKGQSFSDLPYSKDVQYSTAADVLRFLGGIPNIYDPLLEDEEKDELTLAMIENEQMTHENFFPDRGSRDAYGANLAPNLIWNLLLSINPKLKDMAPPSIKGSKGKPPGSPMGTTELRRFLTHGVYGALSGRSISYDLADKIEQISKASSRLDIIANASRSGNMRDMEVEMDKIMKDDAYFMEMMNIEIDDLLMSPQGLENKKQIEKEKSKGDTAYLSAKTRQLNKEKANGNKRSD